MMKNKLISQYTWILALCAITFTTLFYVACSKDKTMTKEENAVKTNPISEEESMLAQAEQFGQTAYTHLRFNYLSHTPEEYINPEIREKVVADYAKTSQELKGLNAEQRIAKNLADKKISEKQATYYHKLLATLKQLDNASNFKQIEDLFKDFNKKLLDDKTMPNTEKEIILCTSVAMCRSIDYFANIAYQPQAQSNNNNTVQSRDFCLSGKKWSCWSSALSGQLSFAGGAYAGNTFGIISGLFTFINAIINLSSNSCDCSVTGATCYTLNGFSIFRASNMDCSGNNIKLCAWGDGPSPSSFTWSISDLDQYNQVIPGTTYPLPNTSDKCASMSPNTNLNKKLLLTVTTIGCGGATMTKSYPFTWGEIVSDPGTVLISGSSDAYVGSDTYYYASGSFLTNPKNTFTWQNNLYQGSFTFGNQISGGGTNTSVGIHWTGASCGPGAFGNPSSFYCYQLSIGGNAVNGCNVGNGNLQTWGSKQVAVRNY